MQGIPWDSNVLRTLTIGVQRLDFKSQLIPWLIRPQALELVTQNEQIFHFIDIIPTVQQSNSKLQFARFRESLFQNG